MEMLCFLPDLLDAVTVTCTAVFGADITQLNGVVCPGEATQLDSVTFECLSEWLIVPSSEFIQEDSQSFNPADLDPLLMAAFIGSGYFILLPLWAASWGVRELLKLVKTS